MRAKFPLLLIVALIASSIGSPVAAQQSIPALASASPARLAPSPEAASTSAGTSALTALDVKAASTPPLKTTGGVPAAVQRLIDAGNGSLLVSTSRATGYARFVRLATDSTTTLSSLLGALESADKPSQAAAFLAQYGDAFGLTDGGASLELVGIETDYLGTAHLVYRQTYQGVPVFAGLMLFHFDANNQLTAVNGVVVPDIAVVATPTLTAEAAADIASARVAELSAGRISAMLARLNIVKNNLFVYRLGLAKGVAGSSHLVYEVEINNHSDVRQFVYVDAHSGEIVDQISAIEDGLSRNVYSGTYAITAVVWQEGDPFPFTGVFSDDINNIILATGEAYNMFASTSPGRDSYDAAGHVMEIVNNDPRINCPNANWNGTTTNYCNGVTSDDVVAHEWGHAYTEYTHGLIYAWQPGALNESYSDIWGESVDLINARQNDNPNTPRTAGACSSFTRQAALLNISSPISITGDYVAQFASFGAYLFSPGVTGTVVLGQDATGSSIPGDPNPSIYDACEPLTNGAAINGNIALVYRGTCNFTVKVKNAQDVGAIGVIVANRNNATGLPGMGGGDPTIVIPSLGISYVDGETIRVELPNTVTGTLTIDTSAGVPDNSYRWLMGEDSSAFGGAIRDMWTPGCFGDPGEVLEANYTCDAGDNGGVHSNSGIPNHAYALLVDGGVHNGITVTALGMTKTLAIYWRAQDVYQTPTTDFADHADALETSCADLIGDPIFEPSTSISSPVTSTVTISAADCTEVADAMAAVEMREDPTLQCGFGPLLDPNAPALCAAGSPTTIFSDTLEIAPSGWTISHTDVFSATTLDWFWDNSLPGGRSGSAFNAPDPVDAGNCTPPNDDVSRVMFLASPVITLPVGTNVARLAFDHYVATETGFDGGNVKISVNGGPYTIVAPADYTFNPYNLTMAAAPANTSPLAGQPGFSGSDGGTVFGSWGQSQVNLGNYAGPGDTIQLRFEFGADGCGGNDGWYMDDPTVYYCQVPQTIEVSPSALASGQAPNTVVTQTLTISNTGDVGSLDWSIVETSQQVARAGNVTASRVEVPTSGKLVTSLSTSPERSVSLSAPLAPQVVLYDQTDNPANNGFPDQDFEAAYDAYDSEGADDFVIPAGDLGWQIESIDTIGTTGTAGTATVDVTFYTNAAGGGDPDLPGTAVCTYTGLTPTDSNGSFTIDLPTSCTLPSGTYWVAIQTNQDFGASGQHFWSNRSVQSGSEGVWRNPGDGFASGCITWTPLGICGVGGSFPDALFRLNGAVGLCNATDLPWLTLSPISGTTAPGAQSSVNVVFDSTGLATGVYTGTLCVSSNDAANPVINVPVTLTVFSAVYLPIIRR